MSACNRKNTGNKICFINTTRRHIRRAPTPRGAGPHGAADAGRRARRRMLYSDSDELATNGHHHERNQRGSRLTSAGTVGDRN